MKRIAALSLTVASIIIMNNPAYAVPWGKFLRGAQEAAEQVPGTVTTEAAENAATKADDAVKGLAKEPEMMTPSTVSGKDDTPTQILENGASGAGLDPEGAIKGARPPEEVVNSPEGAVNVPAPAPAPVVGTMARSVPDQGSGAALPIAGGAALAVTYGIYRAVKGRR